MLLHSEHTFDIPRLFVAVETRDCLGFTVDTQLDIGQKRRYKEGKTLDVVPVRVGKKQVQFAARLGQFARHQVEAKDPDSGAGIDDDPRVLMLHVTAGCVTPKTGKLRPADG